MDRKGRYSIIREIETVILFRPVSIRRTFVNTIERESKEWWIIFLCTWYIYIDRKSLAAIVIYSIRILDYSNIIIFCTDTEV